jgi:hypothetical protein
MTSRSSQPPNRASRAAVRSFAANQARSMCCAGKMAPSDIGSVRIPAVVGCTGSGGSGKIS